MTPSRILPDLQFSFLCEDVRPEASGNFIVVGLLGIIRVPQVPIAAHRICVFNRWTAGLGQFTENVRLIAPDQATVLRKTQVKFALQDAAHHASNLSLLPNLEFPTAGTYYVEVLVDDVMKLRYPLQVVVVKPPQPAGGPPPTPAQPGPSTSPA